MPSNNYSYLALGDSYTIGEGVPLHASFPYQTVRLLRKKGYAFNAPEIVAQTGWTAEELQIGISQYCFKASYTFVSLLIGVNNQFRERSPHEYAIAFKSLLLQAIAFAGNNRGRVVVLSIPDWGVTPYAAGQDIRQIGNEINAFNRINKEITLSCRTQYIDITPASREAATDASMISDDKLHPAAKLYADWAQQLVQAFLKGI